MHKKIRNLLVVIGMLLFFSGAAHAFSKEDIQFWAGEGENEVGFVIDFNDGSGASSVAWGYRYDDDMGDDYLDFLNQITLAMIEAEDLLSGEYYSMGTNGTSLLWYAFEYDDYKWKLGDTYNSKAGYWNYYATSASEIDGSEEWTVVSRLKDSDVQWFAWKWGDIASSSISPNIPTAAAGNNTVPPVPEPGTFVLLGLGLIGTGIIGRRKRTTINS